MRDLDLAVAQALKWLEEHPHRDYLDAAFVVATSPSRDLIGQRFATSRWPELVEAVKTAAQTVPPVT